MLRSIRRPIVIGCLVLLAASPTLAQQPYRTPPADVVDIVDAPPTPVVSVSPDGEWMTLAQPRAYPTIAQLAEPTLGLAGIRFNPRTNGDDQPPPIVAIRVESLEEGEGWDIPVPPSPQLGYPFWSPDGRHLAYTQTTDQGVELWVATLDSRRARRLTEPALMAARGRPCRWMPDSRSLLCQLVPADRDEPPRSPEVPTGPTIQEAMTGERAPVRTYQNLLQHAFDEQLFDHYFMAQLFEIGLGGTRTAIGEPAIFDEVEPAPDGRSILVSRVHRPYSYLVPLYRFPREVEIWDRDGRVIHRVTSLPLAENVPIGGVPEGPRNIEWRPGHDATLIWSEALDGGDPKAEVEHRDRIVLLEPPYEREPVELARTSLRHYFTRWTASGDLGLAWTWDRPTRATRTVVMQADRPDAPDRIIWDRSSEDAYGDPGDPVMTTTARGERVMTQTPDGEAIYLTGRGASPEGDHPFLDRYGLAAGTAERLWESQDPYYEYVVDLLDDRASRIVTRRESKSSPPNFHVRDLASGELTALTEFEDPAPQLTRVQKRRIEYEREDGVELSGILYLPPDHREGERLPTVVWAYPWEFKSADAAGQVRGSENRFTFYRGYSHLLFLTQGYAVLDDASMPVVGEGEEEPNDLFVEQLVMNARAAIDALVDLDVTDPDRVGVGGHSYGAFMTANLLAHSDLFRAGIARSGAYNRSLTPFGFQNERRTFWEAPEVYFAMSPFMHADSINEPILLVHGEADTNSGTFPVQSRRMYHAVKGLGGTVRLVLYPDEKHGYRARETVLDALYQQFEWFDRFVKNAPEEAEVTATGASSRR